MGISWIYTRWSLVNRHYNHHSHSHTTWESDIIFFLKFPLFYFENDVQNAIGEKNLLFSNEVMIWFTVITKKKLLNYNINIIVYLIHTTYSTYLLISCYAYKIYYPWNWQLHTVILSHLYNGKNFMRREGCCLLFNTMWLRFKRELPW